MLSQILKRVSSFDGLKIIGISGTRGKTITSHMVYHLLKSKYENVALFSSIGYDLYYESGKDFTIHDATNSDLKDLLKRARSSGIEYVVLEVTSRNIRSGVYEGIVFDGAIITNLYDDNIAYYKTSTEYIDTKINFLKKLRDSSFLVFPEDIEDIIVNHSNRFKQNIFYTTYSTEKDVSEIKLMNDGISFLFNNSIVDLKILGSYNVENSIASINMLNLFTNYDFDVSSFKSFSNPDGRMDFVKYNGVTFIIDVSYQSDMISDSIDHILQIKSPHSRLIVVGGSDGRRNIFNRNIGKVLAKKADISILVPDDPRDEAVEKINNDIFKYAENERGVIVEEFPNDQVYQISDKKNLIKRIEMVLEYGNKPFVLFNSNSEIGRINGIDLATKIAKPDDFVYIFGVGNQRHMYIDEGVVKWSEYLVLENSLKNG